MINWVLKGLRTGIRSSRYPAEPETAAGTSPGLPQGGNYPPARMAALLASCPTGALQAHAGRVRVDERRCIHCQICRNLHPQPLPWRSDYEWARLTAVSTEQAAEPSAEQGRFGGRAFRRSVHILVVDAGDCGACLHEVKQLNNPYYNMHRLGFFITPTPRQADVMLVVGAGCDQMRSALEKSYAAMPAPKRVVAVGTCALSGGLFEESFVCSRGIAEILPVAVEVPGHPPPPLAILHGLLVAVGRRPPAPKPGDD